jgi:hypothetical protein
MNEYLSIENIFMQKINKLCLDANIFHLRSNYQNEAIKGETYRCLWHNIIKIKFK